MQDVGKLVAFLQERKLKLSTAESCTCGLMASLLANEPGCGQVLDCGFIVYSAQSKHHLLGVDFATMERFGLTSEEVATEMAIGALKASRADRPLESADPRADARSASPSFPGEVTSAVNSDEIRDVLRGAVDLYADTSKLKRLVKP